MVQGEVRGRRALPAVAVGVLAVSAAAIFIRLADAPAIAVAFWRCALGAALLLPPAMVRRERFPRGKTLYVGVASGVALGVHFGFWISSFDYTSVAASVVLVSTQPVFVAILAYLIFGERTSPLFLRASSPRWRALPSSRATAPSGRRRSSETFSPSSGRSQSRSTS